ncbi:MAG: molecular chaperone HtpG [Deltaproteobacteria bacterium]|nr:molecular chaperone HtpG [Deltaproteobacteria bacterium]
MTDNQETMKFEAEAKQILDLMIHSLYSNKEIFLRELVSNASDALDKLRFEGLTKPELLEGAGELEIRVEMDKDARTLTVKDNGIGMSREEVMTNIGTIAKSGTKELLQRLKEAKAEEIPSELIGQFGVGFYSGFMVAKKVSLVTRHAGEETATRWESAGDGTYTVSDADSADFGTAVTLHLKDVDEEDGLEDFTEDWVVKRIIKQYSDFVRYPIKLKVRREKEEDGEKKVTFEDETVNSMKAIWLRSESEVTEEEHGEFYKHISHDWNEPYTHVSMKAEGRLEYQALLYLPSRAPFDLYYQTFKWGPQLYVKNVKIMDNCEDLLPPYLRFIKGVVDSADLSLNVSREILQHDRQITQIKSALTKKVLDALKKKMTDGEDKYLEFFKEFGAVLKEGIGQDAKNKDRIVELVYFESSHDPNKPTTLVDYVSRMKENQKEIYYLVGESRKAIESSPHLEAIFKKEYEVLFFTDPVDEFMTTSLPEFEGLKLKSVGKGQVELGSDEEKAQVKKELEDKGKEYAGFLGALQKELADHISEVRLSNRLTTSPACLVGSDGDLSPHIERMLIKNKVDVPDHKRIMEINQDHEIVQKLKARFDVRPTDLELADHAQILFGQALLAEGSPLPDPATFAKLVAELMHRSLG